MINVIFLVCILMVKYIFFFFLSFAINPMKTIWFRYNTHFP